MTESIVVENDTSEYGTTAMIKVEELHFDNIRPLITALWFLQGHMRDSSAMRVCVLQQ